MKHTWERVHVSRAVCTLCGFVKQSGRDKFGKPFHVYVRVEECAWAAPPCDGRWPPRWKPRRASDVRADAAELGEVAARGLTKP